LLARSGVDDADLERLGAVPIDLVAINLYPFERTLASPGASFGDLIENIDIGGPSMLRSAAKNHERVSVVCDDRDYDRVIVEMDDHRGEVPLGTRRRLAAKAFAHTAAYDTAIATWLSRVVDGSVVEREK
jgi:phosphoribosylaminoimidazolecarboxamide formyltransferase/IMP cyclohydrolase